MASVLYPSSPAELPLIQRATAFCTVVECKTMHNAQVADLDTENIDKYINKGLRRISGLVAWWRSPGRREARLMTSTRRSLKTSGVIDW